MGKVLLHINQNTDEFKLLCYSISANRSDFGFGH